MDNPSDQMTLKNNRPGAILVGLPILLGIVIWLVSLFNLTKEERLAAGIRVNHGEQDE